MAICDDQEAFRQVMTLVLGLEPGIEVVGEAADGREAVDLVTRLSPDVLLLDIAMPVMDGLEALPLIREAAPRTSVAMLTGVASEQVRERALAGGAALFIEKGTDAAEMTRQIRNLCPEGGAG
ncbi:MAG: response regulator transcription factor [Actinobacteria bacterium]|nr:response regulator transcription factor [Actinomycetota bacterium]